CPPGRQHLSPAGTPPDIAYAMPSPKGRGKVRRTDGADGGRPQIAVPSRSTFNFPLRPRPL
ncbi:MAG: hypothetical protein IJF34_08310, partial [Clostridia bacterium]|nr:hypothetical protein [Clostridia bacterium]